MTHHQPKQIQVSLRNKRVQLSPTRQEFQQHIANGDVVVMVRAANDLDTPISALLKLRGDGAHAFLLESVEGGNSLGRYSVLGFDPDQIWRLEQGQISVNSDYATNPDDFQPLYGDPIAALRKFLAKQQAFIPADAPPMAGAVFGYLGYGFARLGEAKLPDSLPDELGLPDGYLLRPKLLLVFDHVRREIFLIRRANPQHSYDSICVELQRDWQQLNSAITAKAASQSSADLPHSPPPAALADPPDFRPLVAKAKEYIAAGDIFQVVLSQRYRRPLRTDSLSYYRALRRLNPSPFLFWLDFPGFAVVGSSPEILVRLRDGKVTIRPLAGTRKRGQSRAEDTALAADLLQDEKELAEHLMLLDLGRNDVGRVAQLGSVQVIARNAIEYYSHVMHIVSEVEGLLRPDADAVDALLAGFPAGTVSGAPKIRAMEIIDELEPVRRGIYGGAVLYFSPNGAMDSCITLRTAIIKDNILYAQAGAGIVHDSIAEHEDQECRNKAAALLRAAEIAET